VGDHAILTARVTPAITSNDAVTGYNLSMKLDPVALWPTAANATLGTAQMGYDPLTGILNVSNTGTAQSGSTLFTLDFIGLSGGTDQNPVRITSAAFGT